MSRYLFVIPTLAFGGAERVVSVLSSALADQKQEVGILKYYSLENEYLIENNNVELFELTQNCREGYEKLSYAAKVLKVRQIIKKYKPDYVIPFMFSVALCTACATIGVNTIVAQSIRINPALGPSSKFLRLIRDSLVYRSKISFVQNNEQKNYFHEKYRGKIKVIYNPITLSLFNVKHISSSNNFVICTMGRLEKQKNFPLLIDAFSSAFKNTNCILKIYGEGTEQYSLLEKIQKMGMQEQVLLMGRTNDVAKAYSEADMFILSSDFEGMPNALMEAMACGIPCVSTDCPTGPSSLINNGINGYLVPVNDKDLLADAMMKIYSSDDKGVEMGERGRHTIIDKCTPQNIAKQIISAFESIGR